MKANQSGNKIEKLKKIKIRGVIGPIGGTTKSREMSGGGATSKFKKTRKYRYLLT